MYGILTNIDYHPFIREIFLFFDKNSDGLVDFNELIVGLDIIERGNFDEKSQYCYQVYDIYGQGLLDIYTLRQLLKRSYSEIVVGLDKVLKLLETEKSQVSSGISWPLFE